MSLARESGRSLAVVLARTTTTTVGSRFLAFRDRHYGDVGRRGRYYERCIEVGHALPKARRLVRKQRSLLEHDTGDRRVSLREPDCCNVKSVKSRWSDETLRKHRTETHQEPTSDYFTDTPVLDVSDVSYT